MEEEENIQYNKKEVLNHQLEHADDTENKQYKYKHNHINITLPAQLTTTFPPLFVWLVILSDSADTLPYQDKLNHKETKVERLAAL